MGKIDANEGISNNERKKLVAYLRNKKDKVGLMPDKSRALDKENRKNWKKTSGSKIEVYNGIDKEVLEKNMILLLRRKRILI